MPHIRPPSSTRLIDAPEGSNRVEEGLSRSFGGAAQDIGFKSEALRAASTRPETDAGEAEPVAAVDSLRMGKSAVPSEGDPRAEKGAVLRATQDTITGAMSATEILRYLVLHGCLDISNELGISHVTEFPVSSGGFGDVYRATLRNGDRVGLKCIRMLVGSTEEGRKFIKCVDIADGVDYMHQTGIVHGDLKPENILIADDHTPKLTDFGNAVLSEYTLQFSRSTTTPSVSMRWTAPEILTGESKSTQMGDIYALGMIIFETTTGLLPFAGVRDSTIMFSVASGKVPSRPEEHIPTGVEQADRLWSVITRCWAYDSIARPKAREVKNAMTGLTPEGLLSTQS
ncbi:unnamed protein product [Rhizoctonia solani]|uniref:Protein kinase domain-containing protein n=1 Tax=Rhizoctonia solani TaxID=456999 RepID=A0A8H3BKH0_9AGAM|nr:unnamed protein product [Rhizoctonia solani]